MLIGQYPPQRLGFNLPTFPSRLNAVTTANLLVESERKKAALPYCGRRGYTALKKQGLEPGNPT